MRHLFFLPFPWPLAEFALYAVEVKFCFIPSLNFRFVGLLIHDSPFFHFFLSLWFFDTVFFPMFLVIFRLLFSRVTVLEELRPKRIDLETRLKQKDGYAQAQFQANSRTTGQHSFRPCRMWSGRVVKELPKVTRNSLIGKEIVKGRGQWLHIHHKEALAECVHVALAARTTQRPNF